MLLLATTLRRCAVDKKIATRIEQALVRVVGLEAVAGNMEENQLLYFQGRAIR